MKYVVFTTKHHDGFCMFDSKWMEINDEGIYNSKVLSPYKEDNICMTQQANGNVYFFYLCEENETVMPSEIFFKSHRPVKGATVKLLGYKSPLKWEKIEEGFMVTIPEKIRNKPPSDYVWTIKVSQIEHR